jgi:hypothetical protein
MAVSDDLVKRAMRAERAEEARRGSAGKAAGLIVLPGARAGLNLPKLDAELSCDA